MLAEIKKAFTVIDPPMRYSTQVARALYSIAPNSRKKYREKYGNFLSGVRSDIEALGKAVYEDIINPKSKR